MFWFSVVCKFWHVGLRWSITHFILCNSKGAALLHQYPATFTAEHTARSQSCRPPGPCLWAPNTSWSCLLLPLGSIYPLGWHIQFIYLLAWELVTLLLDSQFPTKSNCIFGVHEKQGHLWKVWVFISLQMRLFSSPEEKNSRQFSIHSRRVRFH